MQLESLAWPVWLAQRVIAVTRDRRVFPALLVSPVLLALLAQRATAAM